MVRSLTKLQGYQITQIIVDEDIWSDDETWWLDEYRENYWDGVLGGEMSWQWYMGVKQLPDWVHVQIHPDHKVDTVIRWLHKNYPMCGYKVEKNSMIIQDPQAATMVALKWA